jgi:hypothetical protein
MKEEEKEAPTVAADMGEVAGYGIPLENIAGEADTAAAAAADTNVEKKSRVLARGCLNDLAK